VFPEILELAGGGASFQPRSTESLTAALQSLLDDREGTATLGAQGAEGVRKHFSADRMVAETETEYLRLVAGQ
jgi:hypothetical protein